MKNARHTLKISLLQVSLRQVLYSLQTVFAEESPTPATTVTETAETTPATVAEPTPPAPAAAENLPATLMVWKPCGKKVTWCLK